MSSPISSTSTGVGYHHTAPSAHSFSGPAGAPVSLENGSPTVPMTDAAAVFATRLLGTPPPPLPSDIRDDKRLSMVTTTTSVHHGHHRAASSTWSPRDHRGEAGASTASQGKQERIHFGGKKCPYPSPLSPNDGGILPPINPSSPLLLHPRPQQQQPSHQQLPSTIMLLEPRTDNSQATTPRQPVLKLKPVSELGFQPPLPSSTPSPAVAFSPSVSFKPGLNPTSTIRRPYPEYGGRRRSLSMTNLPTYLSAPGPHRTHLPSPSPTSLSRYDADVSMSDGEERSTREKERDRRPYVSGHAQYHLSSAHYPHAQSRTYQSHRPRFSSPISMRPASAASLGPDIGKKWWDNIVTSAASPLRPPLHMDPERKNTNDDGEHFGDDDDSMSGVEQTHTAASTPLRRFLDIHHPPPAPLGALVGLGTPSTPTSPYQDPRPLLHASTSSSAGVAPSPTGSNISLPSALPVSATSSTSQRRESPAPSASSSTNNGSARRTKPNYLNRPNVPLYNRSKVPVASSSTASPAPANSATGSHMVPTETATAYETIFTCNYVPPRSSNPLVAQAQQHIQPCETTSLKKADMLRHVDEIHAKDEAERVFRGDLDLERATRYLADLAEMVVKETKVDLEGSVTINVPPTQGTAAESSKKTISNMTLRAQADTVRHSLRNMSGLAVNGTTMTPTGAEDFDFVGMRCEDFKELAVARLATHRVWRCGCGKVFGTQRSMERHKTNKHHNGPMDGMSELISTNAVASSSRGTKRAGSGGAATRAGSSKKQQSQHVPGSPLPHPESEDEQPSTFERRPLKRARTDGSASTAVTSTFQDATASSSHSPMGQQDGTGLQMELGERSTLVASEDTRMEDDQLAEDLLQLAEGGRHQQLR